MIRTKSKAIATWLALLLGCLGAHRFYLYGLRDRLAWLFVPPSVLGLIGVQRMQALGQDDRLGWVLIPLLGASLAVAMLEGIVYGLTPDEPWNARHNPARAAPPSGWLAVFGVIACLMVGGTVLIASIAFSAQRFFEYQLITAPAGS